MMQTQFFPTLALLAVVQVVTGAYVCPSGYNDKTGTPRCAGAVSSTCTTLNCCAPTPTCASFSAAWLVEQALGKGCAADKGFFDTKKLAVEVASPRGADQVKAACCTPFTNAKCSDWAAVHGSCPAGKNFVGTNSCPADGANGMKMSSKAKYHGNCCVERPKTCSSFGAAWLTAQLMGNGCAKEKGFFDTKKLAVAVAGPAGEDQVKAACCTPFADAKCSDWNTMSCASGTYRVGTNSAPPDNVDGNKLSIKKFRDSCCSVPMKCADYTADTEASRSMPQAAISMVAMAGVLAAWVGA